MAAISSRAISSAARSRQRSSRRCSKREWSCRQSIRERVFHATVRRRRGARQRWLSPFVKRHWRRRPSAQNRSRGVSARVLKERCPSTGGSGALTKHLDFSSYGRLFSAPHGCFDPIPPALHLAG